MALAAKIQDDDVLVIDELAFQRPTTREMAQILKALGLAQAVTLITTCEYDLDVYRSARNISGVSVSPVAELNALSVLHPHKILMTKAALVEFQGKVREQKPTQTT
jgi:large subunit ribosomal protein L4